MRYLIYRASKIPWEGLGKVEWTSAPPCKNAFQALYDHTDDQGRLYKGIVGWHVDVENLEALNTLVDEIEPTGIIVRTFGGHPSLLILDDYL